MVRVAAELEANADPAREIRVGAWVLAQMLKLPSEAPWLLDQVGALVRAEECTWLGFGGEGTDHWFFFVDRNIRRYAGVTTVEEFWGIGHPEEVTDGIS